jgi:flagellar hook-associated protein 2
MRIAVSGDDALKTLLNHNPAGTADEQGFSQTVAAQNAKFKVDGVAISKPTNVASDIIDGVTLTLTKTNVGTPTSFTVARDASAVTGAVGQFVFAFNTINQTIKDMTAYNAATKTGAVFSGDAAVRGIQSQLRGMLSTPVQGGSGAFTLLSQVGVTFQKDGTLAVDNTKLQAAVDSNFSDIAAVFAAVGSASDATVKYTGASAKTVAGAYAVNITQLATQGVSTAQAAPANLTIDDSNDTLQVLLDGVTATIKLAHDTYADPAALAAQMQSRINGTAAFTSAGSAVKVSVVGGNLTLTSNRFGSGSNVSISGGSGASNLMGATPVTAAGLDVAGTIGGVAATGSGRSLKGAAGSPAEGLSMEISALGNRGTVNYSQGYGSQYDKLLSSMLGTDGVLSARTEGLNATIKALGDQRTRLTDRLATIEQRYRAQFTALDTAISSMSTTSNFLTQQLNKINSM